MQHFRKYSEEIHAGTKWKNSSISDDLVHLRSGQDLQVMEFLFGNPSICFGLTLQMLGLPNINFIIATVIIYL